MKAYVFDIETNGLLDQLTKVHSLVLRDVESGEVISCADQEGYEPIALGLDLMSAADTLVGHHVIGFDLPALDKVYGWKPTAGTQVRDTLVLTRLIWPDVLKDDMKLAKKGFPKKMMGRHTLEAWGHRLQALKRGDIDMGFKDFKGPWDTWCLHMHERCEGDTGATLELYRLCVERLEDWGGTDLECVELEHAVQWIICRQERHGFAFNTAKASALYGKLSQERERLQPQAAQAFGPWWRKGKLVTPPRTIRYKDPTQPDRDEGGSYNEVKLVTFNPNSRQQIADRFIKVHGWVPTDFTKDGHPKIDDDVLTALPYPEAAVLAELFVISKRIAQVAEGKEAWLHHVKDGVIHGRVISNGAYTGRMSHQKPNLAQVPSVEAPFGYECRDCWEARPGKVLVGVDADGLEMCDLAGYLAMFDGGAYTKLILTGKKEDGTDMHSRHAKILGCSRSTAKTFFYAYIYGSGNPNLGLILGHTGNVQQLAPKGRAARERLERLVPALGTLVEKVKAKAKARGYIVGLDGRRLPCRHAHAVLNTLLQSAGAVQMKRALVILDRNLKADGYQPGRDYEFVANVHDEFQIETLKEHADAVASHAIQAIRAAGSDWDFPCPLDGSAQVAETWAGTH